MPVLNFNDSIIIVAHPDDEILWFNSILDKVEKIVFCFHGNRLNNAISKRRNKLLSQYPLKNVLSLNVEESNAYKEKHYTLPIETKQGLLIYHPWKNGLYQNNFYTLERKLKTILPGYQTVFTHNPWGEYGHEEHVQVYRVLKKLQTKFGFDLFFNNYISGKSLCLGKRYLFKYSFPWITYSVDKDLYANLMLLYIKNNCWTWPKDWLCFKDESFLKDEIKKKHLGKYEHLPPLNIIRH